MTRRDRVTRDKTPRINALFRHLYRPYVVTRALLNSLNILILIDLQPLPATFIKFQGGTQRSLKLIYIWEACSLTGPLKEVKLVCAGAGALLRPEAFGKKCPAWGS